MARRERSKPHPLKGGVSVDAATIASAHFSSQPPQHMQALAHANRVRLARAALKRSIAHGERSAAEVIRDCPWETESMTLAELLTSQRRWGRTRARKFLLGLALNENKRLGTYVVLRSTDATKLAAAQNALWILIAKEGFAAAAADES